MFRYLEYDVPNFSVGIIKTKVNMKYKNAHEQGGIILDDIMKQVRLQEIRSKITQYSSVKNEIEGIKRDCAKEHENWKTDFNRLANSRELSEVKRKNVFEGNMADILHREVGDAISQIKKGVAGAETLESVLGIQIKKLEGKIQDLKAEKQRLEQSSV